MPGTKARLSPMAAACLAAALGMAGWIVIAFVVAWIGSATS